MAYNFNEYVSDILNRHCWYPKNKANAQDKEYLVLGISQILDFLIDDYFLHPDFADIFEVQSISYTKSYFTLKVPYFASSDMFLKELRLTRKCFSEDGYNKLLILGYLIIDTLYKTYGNIWKIDKNKRKELAKKVFSSDYNSFVNALKNYEEVEKIFSDQKVRGQLWSL